MAAPERRSGRRGVISGVSASSGKSQPNQASAVLYKATSLAQARSASDLL